MSNDESPSALPALGPFNYPLIFNPEAAHSWSGAEVTDEQIRALSVGVIFGWNWGADHDRVTLSSARRDNKSEAIDVLHKWWGVTSAEEVADTVSQLFAGMHADLYAVVHPLVVKAVSSGHQPGYDYLPRKHQDFLRTYAEYCGYRNIDVFARVYERWLQAIRLGLTKHLPRHLPDDIVGWDLTRAVFIARGGHTAGYISEEQAWSMLTEGLRLARRHYRNWQQLGEAYLVGHAFWSAEDLSDLEKQSKVKRTQMIRHWERPDSPWRRVALHPGDPVY